MLECWLCATSTTTKGQIISRVFGVFNFLQKMNEGIQLYYYDISRQLVFVRFLDEIEDTKKPFRNDLTFTTPIQDTNFRSYSIKGTCSQQMWIWHLPQKNLVNIHGIWTSIHGCQPKLEMPIYVSKIHHCGRRDFFRLLTFLKLPSALLKGVHPIIFGSNIFPNSHLIQKCIQFQQLFWNSC